MLEDIILIFVGMIYAGGLMGIIMAIAEDDLRKYADMNNPRAWQVILAIILFIMWPATITAILVDKGMRL